jgi:hypothetical protein
MSQRDPIRLYVTHGWEESDDYLRVFEYLESARNFYYGNLTAPKRKPSGGQEAEREEMRRQMAHAELIIALSSLAETDPDALLFQLNWAKSIKRPVMLLPCFGREVARPRMLDGLFNETAGWDERALADTTRKLARHEDTARFDTIEFKLD